MNAPTDALAGCEQRCSFWKALAYAATGGLFGVLLGAAPVAWRDLATVSYVQDSSPYVMARPLIEARLLGVEKSSGNNEIQLQLLKSTLSELNGNVQALLAFAAKEPANR